MESKKRVIGRQNDGIKHLSSMDGWIIMPPDIDRIKYVNKCLQTGTILFKSRDNQVETYVIVNKGDIHNLRFPSDETDAGSVVTVVKDPIYGICKVVAIHQENEGGQEIFEENQFRISKGRGDKLAEIDLKGNTGEIQVFSNTGSNTRLSSNLKFLNALKRAQLNLEVQGNMNIVIDDTISFDVQKKIEFLINDSDSDSDKTASFSYEYGRGFEVVDEFENEIKTTDKGIRIKTKNGEELFLDESGFTFRTSKEDLKKILNDLMQELLSAIITTPSGPGSFGPTTIGKITQIQQRLNNLFGNGS